MAEDKKVSFAETCGILPSFALFVGTLERDVEQRPFGSLLMPDAGAHGSMPDFMDRLSCRFSVFTVFHIW